MALTKISRSLLDTGVSDSSDATAITIDSSENVGIANTSPVSKLDVTHTITANNGDSIASFGTSGSGGWANSAHQVIIGGPSLSTYTGLIIFSDSTSGNGQLSFADGKGASDSWRGSVSYNHASDFMKFDTNANEVMRFTSAGAVVVGKTAYDNDNNGVALHPTSPSWFTATDTYPLGVNRKGTDGTLIQFTNDQASCGTITCSGTTTNYGGSSDYRMKENIQVMEKGLERVNKLNPVKFTWKEEFGGGESEGFIAHEIQEAGWNEGVVGKKDGQEMQAVDYGKLTPLLVKAIQEQQEQIEALQSEINTLKGE